MSDDEQDADDVDRTPSVDDLTNGEVRIVIDVSDPVADLGVRTERVSVESNGKVSEELAQHIWDEYLFSVEEEGVEVFD